MKLHRVKTPTLKPAYIAALLPTGVAINYAGSLLRNMLGVPLFLDSGGTLLVTFIAGPWMGVVCAILQACMVALTLGPIHIVEFLPPPSSPSSWVTPPATASPRPGPASLAP